MLNFNNFQFLVTSGWERLTIEPKIGWNQLSPTLTVIPRIWHSKSKGTTFYNFSYNAVWAKIRTYHFPYKASLNARCKTPLHYSKQKSNFKFISQNHATCLRNILNIPIIFSEKLETIKFAKIKLRFKLQTYKQLWNNFKQIYFAWLKH